jgi:outer membrane receptor protein involved in Fe transport
MSMRTWVVLLSAVVLLGITGEGLAQTTCERALGEAQKSFDQGIFETIPADLASCLAGRPSRAESIQARSLLARAWIFLDEMDKARAEVAAILRLDPTFTASSPPRFAALIAQVKREEQTTQVASVSKTNESLREAPATVVVVTAEEIQRRGYLDLEQLLHDLPGFDISRLNGDIYSNTYHPGYRSANDRLLFLVDGVEQNELSSNILYLSRQFPLTNIDRVEVIYGPASTMYGANAYTGAISVITKDAEVLAGDRTFSLAGQVTAGGYQTRAADVTLAGKDRGGSVAWSVAASIQQTKERDLSGFSNWDPTYQTTDYAKRMRLTGLEAEVFVASGKCATPSPYFQCTGFLPFQRTVALTAAGADLVRRLDADLIRDQNLGFDDRGQSWSVDSKLRISNLTLGLQTWKSREGIASEYPSTLITGRTTWTPRETAVYFKYYVPMERVKVNIFSRYEQTGVERHGSRFEYLHSYANGFLSMASLVAPCVAPSDQKPVGCPPAPAHPWVETVDFAGHSNQLRTELTAVVDSFEKVKAVAGLEVAKSSIESQLEQTATGPGQLFHAVGLKPEQIEHTDLAFYAQGSWKPRPFLKFVFAGRVTHNEINHKAGASGFGTLFTPRAGVMYLPAGNRFVLKAMYSEAFKDPTDAQKFGVVTGVNEFRSRGLKPETVRNVELSAAWEPADGTAFEASLYEARYGDVVSFAGVTGCGGPGCRRYENRDEIRIRGVQTVARHHFGRADIWGNYTHTEPFLTNPKDLLGNPLLDSNKNPISRLRVADIAADQLSIGIDTHWPDRLTAGLRARYVGARPTGAGTTEARSPLLRTDAHTTADAILSDSRLVPRATLQLIVYNIFDKQYYDPALDPTVGVSRVPQAGRTIYLRLIYGLPRGR